MRHRLTLRPINLLNFIDVIEEVDDNPYASLDFYPWGRIEASNFDVLTFVQSALDMNFTCGSFWVLHNNVRIKLWNDSYLFIKCLFSIRVLVYYFICVSEFVVSKIGKKKKDSWKSFDTSMKEINSASWTKSLFHAYDLIQSQVITHGLCTEAKSQSSTLVVTAVEPSLMAKLVWAS